jgi:uncharacterized short protein YbdD (DUF466 family)
MANSNQLGRNIPKPSRALAAKRSRGAKRKINPSIGDMGSSNPKRAVTNNEKKLLKQLQKETRNRGLQKYENYVARVKRTNAPMGSLKSTSSRQGTRSIGSVGMGFSTHFDKKNFFEGMNEEVTTLALGAHTLAQRYAMNRGREAAELNLTMASHLGGKNRSLHVDSDVFSHLKASLHSAEANFSASGSGGLNRYIRHYGGSFGSGEWSVGETSDNPQGLMGWHKGKKPNLSIMYEEGLDPFPFSDKLHILYAGQGAVRSRADDYIATLKGEHPGFPRVRYMAAWYERTTEELSQRLYDDLVGFYIKNGVKGMRSGL